MTTAEVRMWGTRIGAVSWDRRRDLGFFEFDPGFLRSRIEVAPLTMPLSTQVYSFPALDRACFHGLPGLLADVLPDRFGNAIIDAWLASQGRTPESFDPVERLCYTGARGMGALEFAPAIQPGGAGSAASSPLDVAALVELAGRMLSDHAGFVASLARQGTGDGGEGGDGDAVSQLLRVGTSAGGARAKAVIAWNPDTGEVRSGQVPQAAGFSYWLLKFDGVRGNRDRELDDPQGFGLIEYGYHLMALAAGIEMSECRILSENGRSHFVTKRFDRTAAGEKIHMQSLSAIAHLDFNMAGAHSYEQAMLVMRELDLPMRSVEEQFRRMVFNVLGRNQDDHVKNIAFLMDKSGAWALSPAFDVVYAHNPSGVWTHRHQMTINGKRDDFDLGDFIACGETVSLRRGRAAEIVEEVREAVSRWREFAERAGVPDRLAEQIAAAQRRLV